MNEKIAEWNGMATKTVMFQGMLFGGGAFECTIPSEVEDNITKAEWESRVLVGETAKDPIEPISLLILDDSSWLVDDRLRLDDDDRMIERG